MATSMAFTIATDIFPVEKRFVPARRYGLPGGSDTDVPAAAACFHAAARGTVFDGGEVAGQGDVHLMEIVRMLEHPAGQHVSPMDA